MSSINKVPAEVWSIIFGQLNNYQDCVNVTKVSSFWEVVIYSCQSPWLFLGLFPKLVDYLSKDDILRCRLVCKKWSRGVDYFIENCAFYQPSLQDVLTVGEREEFRLGRNSRHLQSILRARGFRSHKLNSPLVIKKFLKKIEGHARCPIITKAVEILIHKPSWQDRESFVDKPPNLKLLEEIGHHILCLSIRISGYSAVETLNQIVTLLKYVPNLKMLDVEGDLENQYERDSVVNKLEAMCQIMCFLKSILICENASVPVKLQGFRVGRIGGSFGEEFREALFKLFVTE